MDRQSQAYNNPTNQRRYTDQCFPNQQGSFYTQNRTRTGSYGDEILRRQQLRQQQDDCRRVSFQDEVNIQRG